MNSNSKDSNTKDRLSALPAELTEMISKNLGTKDAVSLSHSGRIFNAVLYERFKFHMLHHLCEKDGRNVAHWAAEHYRVDILQPILTASQSLKGKPLRKRITDKRLKYPHTY